MLKFTIDRKIKVEVNMADINKNLKSICSFYASEWHLVTMLLPNLDQKINKGVKVTTILEKDLTKEMETLLTKLHLDDKKEIINIGWQKSNLEDIKQAVQNNDCIIINGTKEFIEKAREEIGINTVALSGGVYQNKLLLDYSVTMLEERGFHVLRHHLLPPNDGGISLGQAVAAMRSMCVQKGE